VRFTSPDECLNRSGAIWVKAMSAGVRSRTARAPEEDFVSRLRESKAELVNHLRVQGATFSFDNHTRRLQCCPQGHR